MATMWVILQLFAELQVEAEPGPTLPTLRGSDERAAKPVDGEGMGQSPAILQSCKSRQGRTRTLPTLLGSY